MQTMTGTDYYTQNEFDTRECTVRYAEKAKKQARKSRLEPELKFICLLLVAGNIIAMSYSGILTPSDIRLFIEWLVVAAAACIVLSPVVKTITKLFAVSE